MTFRTEAPPITAVSYVGQKATQDVRNKLVSLLKLPDLYSLDRLDLSAETSVDTAAQARVTAVLAEALRPNLSALSRAWSATSCSATATPRKMTWSFVLYERGGDRNYVRIHADSLNQPFDINSGAKLQLGSTAKLRTLITYLTSSASCTTGSRRCRSRDLLRTAASAEDPLTEWAAGYLARTPGPQRCRRCSTRRCSEPIRRRRVPSLPAAASRASAISTTWEDDGRPTRRDRLPALDQSGFRPDPARYRQLLHGGERRRRSSGCSAIPTTRSARPICSGLSNADSRRFLHRFYKDYTGLNGNEAMALLADRTQPVPKRLATVFLSIHPDARLAHLQRVPDDALCRKCDLSDRRALGLVSDLFARAAATWPIAAMSPASIRSNCGWLSICRSTPARAWNEILDASAQVRQEAYSWLFKGNPHKQDTRIRILLEQDAFERIYENWKALGYPFSHLVPSLGTAIGASGDRPDALADLMGTIMNGGVRVPTVTIERLALCRRIPLTKRRCPPRPSRSGSCPLRSRRRCGEP